MSMNENKSSKEQFYQEKSKIFIDTIIYKLCYRLKRSQHRRVFAFLFREGQHNTRGVINSGVASISTINKILQEGFMNSIISKFMFICSIFVVCLMTNIAFAGSVQEFKAFASGHLTYYGPQNCQLTDEGCTITDEGTVKGTLFGNGTFIQMATVLWKNGFPNGSGGYCAPASGTINITVSDKSTITANRVGILCEVGGTYTFNSTYFITGGTKRFEGASGAGISTCSVDNSGNVLGFANGSLIKK